jgi:hypothetical protein
MVHSDHPSPSIELPNRLDKQCDATWVKRKEALPINTHRRHSLHSVYPALLVLVLMFLFSYFSSMFAEKLLPRIVVPLLYIVHSILVCEVAGTWKYSSYGRVGA